MYKRMLVPLDGSELAEVVFSYTKEVAARLDLEVILLHVGISAVRDFLPMQRAYIEHTAYFIRQEIKKVQVELGNKSAEAKVRGEVAMGYAAEEILKYAEENNVDFILMATHGRSGMKRWALGNVADKVLRASKVPVWLVRAGIPDEIPYDKWPRRTVLVPLDGSPLAESVLPHVEALAGQKGAGTMEVVLLRICEPPTVPSYYAPELSGVPLNWGQYISQEMAKSKEVAREYLAGIETRLRNSGINVRSEVLVGKAAEEIMNYASKSAFNLIVMATHGRSGFSRLVYGSVAESVLIGVTSPIFLVKPRQPEETAKEK